MVAYAEVSEAATSATAPFITVVLSFLPIVVLIVLIVVFLSRRNKDRSKKVVPPIGERSKWVGAILAFFLGGFGIHRYYLGYKKQGIMQSCSILGLIAGSVCMYDEGVFALAIPCFIYSAAMGIWALVDFVRILTGSLLPVDGMPYKENQSPQIRVNNSSASNNAEAIAKLAKLHEQGILTDDEFQRKKSDLLARM